MAVQESDCTESEIFWAALIDCSVTSSYVKDWRRGWGGGGISTISTGTQNNCVHHN